MAKAKAEVLEEGDDRPVLDLSDTKVKKFLKDAKAKGYVTLEQLNKVLPEDELSSDRIEDTMAMLSEQGITVVDNEEEGEAAAKSTAVATTGTTGAVTKKGNARGSDRTDDPVRMYLREMGAVELLSREGEIAIAKRIEAGRDAMIRGLCESPLTFEAMMVWRDELVNEPHSAARPDRSRSDLWGGRTRPRKKMTSTRKRPKPARMKLSRSVMPAKSARMRKKALPCPCPAWKASCVTACWTSLTKLPPDFSKFRKLQEKLVGRRMEGKSLTPQGPGIL